MARRVEIAIFDKPKPNPLPGTSLSPLVVIGSAPAAGPAWTPASSGRTIPYNGVIFHCPAVPALRGYTIFGAPPSNPAEPHIRRYLRTSQLVHPALLRAA
ncbi:uncharacterized protein L3040_002529 [Drepanopeziza brunnea f. sp. 'multigermtubi']|uniref:uncharacterized protein n=1 Tax=Drepanopeziza brunnea f. sp. 'multigermtubi' TaxID=698441 RepID=UPI00238201F1|nr:hypothetical protein L3040_002529 [Drepanopeziza brunnea f. sp. 'multigermtubi']